MSARPIWGHIPDTVKSLGDLVSFATLLGSLVSMLPAVASLLTIVWTVIRIYETATVQALVKRRKPGGEA